MSSPSEILGEMLAVSDEQIENIDKSINQVQQQIDTYTEEIDGIENGVCKIAENELTDYLDNTKVDVIENLYGNGTNEPFTVSYGPNYGKIDYTDGGITDFEILDSTGNVVYSLSVNWDNDPFIVKRIDDFAFGNDYLTRPLTTGASYGLYPNVDALNQAMTILQNNKSKVQSSQTILKDYV